MAAAVIEKFKQWDPTEEEKRKLRRWGFGAYFVLAAFLFVWIYLPGEAITGAVTTKISGALGRPVEARDISLEGLSGLELDHLSISVSPGNWIEIDRQIVDLALFSTLFGEPKFSATTHTGAGQATLDFAAGSDAVGLDIQARDLDLGVFFPQQRDDRPWVLGMASGRIAYQTPGVEQATSLVIVERLRNLNDSEGQIDLTLRNGRIGGIVAGGYPIPAFNYDEAHVVVSGARNKIKIETFELKGPDLDIELSGTIDVVNPFERSRPNLRLHLTTHGKFKASYDALLATQLKREPDGGLSAFIQGTFGAPRIRK